MCLHKCFHSSNTRLGSPPQNIHCPIFTRTNNSDYLDFTRVCSALFATRNDDVQQKSNELRKKRKEKAIYKFVSICFCLGRRVSDKHTSSSELQELVVHIVGSVVKEVVGGQLLVTIASQECLHCCLAIETKAL